MGMSKKDSQLLKSIQAYFGGIGSISISRNLEWEAFRVTSIEGLRIINNHLNKYPLKTQKQADYLLFLEVFELYVNKKHLTLAGLTKIASIKASMNFGLNSTIEDSFKITPVSRPIISNQEVPHPWWLSGFVCGDGCFLVGISKSNRTKTGFAVRLYFSISQHNRDSELMQNISNFLSCGYWINKPLKSHGEFRVTDFSDIVNIVIPFFEKYPLHGHKQLDFEDFRCASKIILSKNHLTAEGVEDLSAIKKNMNASRIPLK